MTSAVPAVRLLLVEDDEVDREIARRMLKRCGLPHALDEVGSATEALERVALERYDCVLLDYRLPDGTALELLPQLRDRAIESHLPVVLLTGMMDERVAVEAMKGGAYDYVSKRALQPQPLRAAIEGAVIKAAAAREHADAHEKLKQSSLKDELTGLANRRLFLERLEQAVLTAERLRTSFAVVVMDLDLFKQVNDTHGHEAGDQLLVEVGRRLHHTVRRADTVARFGGDEFAALLCATKTPEGAVVVAEKLCAAIAEPMAIHQQPVRVGLTAGIALFPDAGKDAETLLRHADEAMYRAKRSGRTYEVHTVAGALTQRPALSARRLCEAADQHELVLHYQPIIDLRTRSLSGVEALVRWRHPELGLLPPAEFIPAAERSAAIKPITYAVFDAVLDQALAWRDSGLAVPIAVNLSARMLDESELPGRIAAALASRALPPRALTLEIPETGLMANAGRAAESIAALAASGIPISIDDFGTGTSFRYLRDFAISELKVDALFIRDLCTTSRDRSIVNSIVTLGRGFGVRVVAEGIESEAAWRQLLDLDCQYGQGHVISRPLAADALQSWASRISVT